MRVFHFINQRFGLEDLELRRLKIAQIDDLNDPFELRAAGSADVRLRKAFELTRATLAKDCGLLCFSADWSNPVLWSHYADRHRGLCLGFDIPDECLTRVMYQTRRIKFAPRVLENGGEEAQAQMREFLATKYSHWKYETEIRCFLSLQGKDPESGLYFVDFSENILIRQVIVGSESPLGRREVAEALGDLASGVQIFKTRLAFRSFRVVQQRDVTRWV